MTTFFLSLVLAVITGFLVGNAVSALYSCSPDCDTYTAQLEWFSGMAGGAAAWLVSWPLWAWLVSKMQAEPSTPAEQQPVDTR